MLPAFILVTELAADHPDWPAAVEQAKALAEPLASQLGFAPRIRLAGLPPAAHLLCAPDDPATAPPCNLATVLADEAAAGERDIFLIPTMLDFGLLQRAQLAEIAAAARQRFSHVTIAYDDMDPCHPLLVAAWARRVHEKLAGTALTPEQTGLLLAASGDGAGRGRAQSYQLMRLLWEQVGCARADVGFCRHAQPSLHDQLARCTREALTWVVVPQAMWRNTFYDEVRTVCGDFSRTAAGAQPWITTEPIGSRVPPPDREDAMPGLSWLVQRMVNLWQERRNKSAGREPSARRDCCPRISRLRGPRASRSLTGLAGSPDADLCYGSGGIAEIYEQAGLAHLLKHMWKEPDPPAAAPAHVFIKVTWHGYAPGTYTDPVALDMLLGALPARAVLLEGHTSSRNLGGGAWDWARDSRQHRAWIAEQEAEYLRRTGLADVMRQHKAQYLNVTEAFWDGRCAPREDVEAILQEAGVRLHHPDLTAYVPEALLAHRGAPFISFARFKGPTRLAVANLFGLIPDVLRTTWHGPNVAHFARVCCDVAKLYGCLFQMYGMVEGLHAAVRWNRRGLYRSRWGNYDLIPHPGLVTFSRDLAVADVLASRLQGRRVDDSTFFHVLCQELGFPEQPARLPIPEDLVLRLA